jgi:uncharacterized protein GlcG (DUF336 family)
MSTLNLEQARRILARAEEKAHSIRCPQNIAVVDAGGNLIAHVRMDGARIGATEIAMNKAWTARAFDMETAELSRYSQPGGSFYGIHASNHGRVIIFAGGIPIRRNGEIVGAVGVSGGSEEQDTVCAQAGAEALAEQITEVGNNRKEINSVGLITK